MLRHYLEFSTEQIPPKVRALLRAGPSDKAFLIFGFTVDPVEIGWFFTMDRVGWVLDGRSEEDSCYPELTNLLLHQDVAFALFSSGASDSSLLPVFSRDEPAPSINAEYGEE